MKLQASLIILIMIVSVAVMGWVYTMTSAGPAFQERLTTDSRIQQASFMMDSAKSASKDAARTSMNMALRENAEKGGINSFGDLNAGDKRFWFCNGNDVPSPEYINYFLSMKTKYLINQFVPNLNTQDLEITEFDCVDYNLDSEDVSSDNMEFSADFYGSDITVLRPAESTDSNDFSAMVNDVPYWRMYNGFKDWIEDADTQFTADLCECIPYSCDCSPQPGECTEANCEPFYTCIKEKLDKLVNEDLVSKFDDDVDCTYTIDKCYMEKGRADPTGDCGQTCHSWEPDNLPYPICHSPQAGEIDCSEQAQASGEINLETNVYSFADGDQCVGTCYDPVEERMSIIVSVSCTNNDYEVPGEGGPLPLTYSTKLFISQASGGACTGGEIDCAFNSAGDCVCASGGGSTCNNCKIIGGEASAVKNACEELKCEEKLDQYLAGIGRTDKKNCYKTDCRVDENGEPYCDISLEKVCGCDPDDETKYCPLY